MEYGSQKPERAPPPPAPRREADRLRVAVLGVNLWAVAYALPFLLSSPRGPGGWVVAPVPLLALGAGGALLPRHPGLARWTLLCAFPAFVGVAVALLDRFVADPPHSTVGLLFAVLALWAFGASGARALGSGTPGRALQRRPLGAVSPVHEHPRRRITRRLLLSTAGAGGLALAVVAPTLGGRAPLERAFGPAADAAGVLAAVVGGSLGVAVAAIFVAPAMRAARRPPTRPAQLATRLVLFGLVIVMGLFLLHLARAEGP